MRVLNDEEMMNISGGGFNIGIAFGITAGITFLIGLIDGIVRPLKCH